MEKYISVLLDFDEPLRYGDLILYSDPLSGSYGRVDEGYTRVVRGWAGRTVNELLQTSQAQFLRGVVAVVRLYPNPYKER